MGDAKEYSNYRTTALISHASKAVLKILQARLQQYVNHELPDVHAGFRKGRRIRDQIANIRWITEKARKFQKNIYFCFIDYAKAFDCGSQQTVENSSRDGNTTLSHLLPEKSICRSRSQQLEPDREQWTGSKLGKECVNAVYCIYLTYMQSISGETQAGWSTGGIKIVGRNINNLRYTDDITLMADSEEELKSLLMKVKEESEKAGLKFNIQKIKVMASSPTTSWQIDGETMDTVTAFIFSGSRITAEGDCSHEIKTLAPWKKSYDQPWQHIKKQRHYFADKGTSSQSYGFSSGHVCM